MPLDVSTADFLAFMTTQFPPGEFQQRLDRLERERVKVMRDANFTDALQLFKALALPCEVKKKTYFSLPAFAVRTNYFLPLVFLLLICPFMRGGFASVGVYTI